MTKKRNPNEWPSLGSAMTNGGGKWSSNGTKNHPQFRSSTDPERTLNADNEDLYLAALRRLSGR